MAQDYFRNKFFVKFKLTGTQKDIYWQIKEREAFTFETGSHSEFSSINTGANSGNIDIEYLEPAENELYHIHPAVKDGCTYYLRMPSGTDRLGVSKDTDIGFIDRVKSPYFLPNPQYSFYAAIKSKFSIRAANDTGSAVTPKVFFEGMKYRIQEVTDKVLIERLDRGEIPSTHITLGGFTH